MQCDQYWVFPLECGWIRFRILVYFWMWNEQHSPKCYLRERERKNQSEHHQKEHQSRAHPDELLLSCCFVFIQFVVFPNSFNPLWLCLLNEIFYFYLNGILLASLASNAKCTSWFLIKLICRQFSDLVKQILGGQFMLCSFLNANINECLFNDLRWILTWNSYQTMKWNCSWSKLSLGFRRRNMQISRILCMTHRLIHFYSELN